MDVYTSVCQGQDEANSSNSTLTSVSAGPASEVAAQPTPGPPPMEDPVLHLRVFWLFQKLSFAAAIIVGQHACADLRSEESFTSGRRMHAEGDAFGLFS